ncbi:MAG: phosphomevalonate kinase [archaeon]|jgi:phosphomevalonate kinase
MKIFAPGKTMLSGEWSVLEDGIPCVVIAIDQKVSVEINPADKITLVANGTNFNSNAQFNNNVLKLVGNDDSKNFFSLVAKAIEVTLNYLISSGIDVKNFSITTDSSDTVVTLSDGKKAKVGFGSSAAIVVATIAAILAFHGQEINSLEVKEKIFKLGCITHYSAQGKIGSSYDVAASTYGGVLVYQKPDMKWLMNELEQKVDIKTILETSWPLFKAEPLSLPKDFLLSVGFVGYSASTKELVLRLNEFKTKDSTEFYRIINEIKIVTEKLIDALKTNNNEEIKNLLKQNRVLLKEFSDKSNNNLETKELAKLSNLADEAGAVGKFSGAGGGDCGIAISFDKATKNKVETSWKQNRIYLIDVNISNDGVLIS